MENNGMDWKDELRNLITAPEQLRAFVDISEAEIREAKEALSLFPMAVTPYYASLMHRTDRSCPIRRQAIPQGAERVRLDGEVDDPMGEEQDSPLPGLTHRYPDRALLLVTHRCFVYCRHCNRRRKVGALDLPAEALDDAIACIADTPAISDVLISGGDPLFLPTDALHSILERLRAIPHVKTLRIGTRAPVVLPSRVDGELADMLRRFHPLWINTHFNHPAELTPAATEALARLADAGIPLGNQTVLLKGVNDCPRILRDLFLGLVERRVRPYYLFQCDLAPGIGHFRTPVSRGVEIMESLVGHVRSYAVPVFAVDPPDGAGKIPIMPQYLLVSAPGAVVLRNYEGVITRYDEPACAAEPCPATCTRCDTPRTDGGRQGAEQGVSALLSGGAGKSLAPAEVERLMRRRRR